MSETIEKGRKKRKTKKEPIPCDLLEIKKPFQVDIEIIHKIILYRISYYKKYGIKNQNYSDDLTLYQIEKEIENPQFEERTRDILKDFIEINEIEKKRPKNLLEITQKGKKNSNQKKIEILSDYYLNIAQEYIRINIYPENVRKKSRCPECNIIIEKNEGDLNTGILECSNCNCEIQNFLFIPSLKDNGFNTSSSSGYEDRDNFIKKMYRKQGKIHSTFHSTLFEELDDVMKKRGYLVSDQALQLPMNELGEKEGTSLEMLITALSDIKYPKYYNDVDYLAHIYWGWSLLDFSEFESELLEMYDKTQRAYNDIENKERVAALNTEVRLYLQLRSLGIKISRTRFRFQDSQESLEFHQSMWRQMCEATGYSYHSI